jgi:hypothetical protein
MNALNRALQGGLVAVCVTTAVISSAAASKTEKIDALVGLHDLKTAVAIGNYYLKQRTLIAVREELTRLGRDKNLGPDWNPSNPYWRQAENTMARAAMKQVQQQFSNLEWLSEEWGQLDEREFTETQVDLLLAHFKTPYGRKQLMLVDHGMAVHVQGTLTLTDKLVPEVPGAEEERNRMQTVFNDEDREMRYNIDDSPEATRFVMSPLGRRYFVNAMLNVTGMINRRIDETAASLRQTVKALSDQALPAVQAFLRSRPEG